MASFKSFLSAFGHDFIKGLTWLGSPQGQGVITSVEAGTGAIIGVVDPLAAPAYNGIVALINAGLHKVLDVEATAAAVGAQSGTGTQKAAAVVASITPQAAALLQAIGVSNPTAEQVQTVASAVSSGLVAVLNALPAPATAQ